ncbi:MAG: hypothetical protein H6823_10820 [Planctomycetaceae bacterium]|nr:hypothetical protein [Planctomycetaceae bacterium]
MSARDNTFIDAYGLELTNDLEATYAEPVQQESVAQGPVQPDESERHRRSHRFDAAAQRRNLRGPHFDMRRVISQTNEEALALGAFDTSVIDVGAGWSPPPAATQPTIEEAVASEEYEEAVEPLADVVTKVVRQTETPATTEEEVTVSTPPAVAELEPPTAPPAATIEPDERFAPVWEVDRFQWPDEIEQLFKAQTEYFDYAGKKLVAASREGLNILAVTSAHRGEGSTTLALCLARAAAGAGAKVGLLDGNLNRSELGEKLGVDFGSGWQSAAAFEEPLAEAAITGLEEGITLFPSAAGPVSDIKSLGDERVGQVFRAAAASFDLLIVDVGTADLGRNVETLDAAIVARDVRRTSEEETLAVAAALRKCGVKAVGIAENFSSSQANRAAA